MHDISLWSLLTLGFGLGLLHAIDADHIVAVSTLASRRTGKRGAVYLCLSWAAGHGLVLFVAGGAVFLLGAAIPERLSAIAEGAVAFLLIGLGLWTLWRLLRERQHLHFHRHEGFPPHAHWHSHSSAADPSRSRHDHDHRALWVGALHGLAGSAPLFALIPLSVVGSPLSAFTYLLCFNLGVFASMLFFGGLFGLALERLEAYSGVVAQVVRSVIGLGAVGVGIWLLHGL